jgi:dienelactone hydrolase
VNAVTSQVPQVLLFHTALGLRPGVRWFAQQLEQRGLDVRTVDLYGGAFFDDLTAGIEHRDAVGRDELLRRTSVLLDEDRPVIPVGMSLGCRFAQWLSQHHARARGCAVIAGAHDPSELGGSWPDDVPVAVHLMADDPWVELDQAFALLRSATEGSLHRYAGDAHVFFDPDLAEFDPRATELVVDRVCDFVDGLGARR